MRRQLMIHDITKYLTNILQFTVELLYETVTHTWHSTHNPVVNLHSLLLELVVVVEAEFQCL